MADYLDQTDCERCKEEINIWRHNVDADVKSINDPSTGAIGQIHEKINNGLDRKVSWPVAIWIVGILLTLILIVYNYAKENQKDIQSLKENIVSKEDFNKFESKLDKRLEGIENILKK